MVERPKRELALNASPILFLLGEWLALHPATSHSCMLLQSRETASWGTFVVKEVEAVSVVSVLLFGKKCHNPVNLNIMLDSVLLGVSPE